MNSKGQGVVEFVIVLKLIVLFVSGLLYTIYLSYSFIMTDHLLYQSLFCLAEQQSKEACKVILQKKLKALTPFSEVQSIYLNRKRDRYIGQMTWQGPIGIKIKQRSGFSKNDLLKYKAAL